MNDRSEPSERGPATPVLACHDCGLLHRVRPLAEGDAATCTRCGAVLYRPRADSIERTLTLALAALILFVLAHSFPFMTFKLEGRADTSTLLTGVWNLYGDGMWPLALLVFLAATLFPLLKLAGTLYVLLPLRWGRRAWRGATVFRLIEVVHPWAMMEVYLLGVIVAYVKLAELARLEMGVALYAFVGLILVMIAAEATLDVREVWDRFGRQAALRRGSWQWRAGLVSCHSCDQLCRLDRLPSGGHARCPRCGAPLHRCKRESLARTWALIIAARILYIPANLLPVMTVRRSGATRMVLADFDNWIEPLHSMFPRVLVENLSLLLGTDDIWLLPQRRPPRLDHQIEVDVTRFDAGAEGEAVLDARWRIYGRDGERLLASDRSTILERASPEDGLEGEVAALSRALGEFSRQLADAVRDAAGQRR